MSRSNRAPRVYAAGRVYCTKSTVHVAVEMFTKKRDIIRDISDLSEAVARKWSTSYLLSLVVRQRTTLHQWILGLGSILVKAFACTNKICVLCIKSVII